MRLDPISREAKRLAQSAQWMYREHGPGFLARETVDLVAAYSLYPFSKSRFEGRTFRFKGRSIPYFRHHYNRAWRNERCVELGLALDFVARHPGRTLELGNVLAHYRPGAHDVLDKYENSPDVINVDIVDFDPPTPYDVLLSISTLEHVGWDERPREPDKVLRAYVRMRAAIKPGGSMLVTAPLGQNPHLDEYVHDGRLDFPVIGFLKRVSRDNEWREVDEGEVQGAKWGSPYHGTNALFVGMVDATTGP
jgi:hypothetical protein